MTVRLRRSAIGIALLCTAGIAAGCSTDTKMSASDKENFKGGPMPAGFLEKQGGAVPASGSPAQASPAVASTPAPPPGPGTAK